MELRIMELLTQAIILISMYQIADLHLFQGDMMLNQDQLNGILHPVVNSNGYASQNSFNWPSNIIPYDIESKLALQLTPVRYIYSAIQEYEKKTCLRFRLRQNETAYMLFVAGDKCWSHVGYVPFPRHISLASHCWKTGGVLHEIGHALGFHHEHSRPDRDDHVTIKWENIATEHKSEFIRYSSGYIDSMQVPYDYISIMHLDQTVFGNGKITIETKDPKFRNKIGQRKSLSPLDVLQVNLKYKCPGFTPPPALTTTFKPVDPALLVGAKTVIVCQYFSDNIKCDDSYKINIIDAMYGRNDATTCSNHGTITTTKCHSLYSLEVTKKMCHNKQRCRLRVNDVIFRGDPCVGTFKYLKVYYKCRIKT